MSPFLAIALGLLFFDELPTEVQALGLLVGVLVPLFLVSRSEKGRQQNLHKGLMFMFSSALCAALVASISKFGSNEYTAVILFVALINAAGGLFSIVVYSWGGGGKFILGSVLQKIQAEAGNKDYIWLSFVAGFSLFAGYTATLLAFEAGGLLGVVYTIHSLYIVIPIILAIIFYNEHWNYRKLTAIVLTILSLALLK